VDGNFLVGPWLVRPSLNTVSRASTSLHLEPKVMQVLVCLAKCPGEALAKEQLMKSVWPDTFVTDDVLKRCISELRRVFEDDAHEPRIIETIPKRGYRLLMPVDWENESPDSPVARHQLENNLLRSKEGKPWVPKLGITAAIAVLLLLCVLGLDAVRTWQRSRGIHQIQSLAVLPLQNLSGDPAQEYFSDGMTDALITDLAQIASLKVISRTSSMQYKQSRKSLPEIASELNVDGIIEGTVQRSGNRVRITAQLIHGPSDKHLWAQTYERDLQDALQVQKEIAHDTVAGISASLGASPTLPPASRYPLNTEAYDDYLKGRTYVRRAAQHDVVKGMEFLERSIRHDPNYAPAYAELSYAYQVLAMFNHRSPREVLPKAKAAAMKALALDENFAEAHSSLGLIYGQFEWDWEGEERELKRAIELDPNSSIAHQRYSVHLITLRRTTDAIREVSTARELDPFSPSQHSTASYVFRAARQYDLALREARRAVEIDPDDPIGRSNLAATLGAMGMHKEAFKVWLQYLSLDGDGDLAKKLETKAKELSGPGDPGPRLAHITLNYYQEKMKTQYVAALTIAAVYIDLGDKDKMFEWLNKAYEEHSTGLYDIAVEPPSESIRADPRFQDLLRRMNLPVDFSSPGVGRN
jgi:TolB-like protein/DNA-binding winged helix-turn-helix (wHTH) protein